MKRVILIWPLLFLAGCLASYQINSIDGQAQWFILNAQIKGHLVRFVMDTGWQTVMMMRRPAERLGLHIAHGPPDSKAAPLMIGLTDPYPVTFDFGRAKWSFMIFDAPPAPGLDENADGVIGWPAFQDAIFRIAGARAFTFLRTVPKEVKGWQKLPIVRDAVWLKLVVRTPAGDREVLVDTGGVGSIGLSTNAWRDWTTAHPVRSRTITAYYTPSVGTVIKEEALATE